MKFCEKCGNSISEERFCPNCGNEIMVESEQTTIEATDAQVECDNTYVEVNESALEQIKKSPKKVLILAGAGILAVVILIILISSSGPNFKKVYRKHCDEEWAEVASDGSYLSIDTNPDDEEDSGIAYYEAYTAIKEVNEELGMPESLLQEMGQTTYDDGKQSEDFGKINVSWKYHPDKGLEVTYKKK